MPRPSLATDVLLLAVGDRAGWRTRGDVGVVLAGALIAEQTLAGRSVAEFAPGAKALAKVLLRDAPGATAVVARPLQFERAVRPLEHRVLGLFPRRGYAVEERHRRPAVDRLLGALHSAAYPQPPAAALVVLCAVSGLARCYAPPPRSRTDRRALAARINSLELAVGPDTAAVLRAVRDAYRRSGGGGDGFVSDSGDGYGDSGGDGGGGDGGGGDGGGGGGD